MALLTPPPDRIDVRQRMIIEGKLIPANGSLADLGPPPHVEVSGSVGDALDELRDERLTPRP